MNTVTIEQIDKFRLYDVNNAAGMYSGHYAFLGYYAHVSNSNAFSSVDSFGNLLNEKEKEIPIGVTLPWHKTFSEKSSGTNDSISANRLVDSTATFIADGVQVGMVIYNEADDTSAHVLAVNSENNLTISDSIFTATGKNYKIYATPALSEIYVECNGQIIDDVESIYHGVQAPDLNNKKNDWNSAGAFVRGGKISGVEEDDTGQGHRHAFDRKFNNISGNLQPYTGARPIDLADLNTASVRDPIDDGINGVPRTGKETKPVSMTMVFIMRIK